MTLKFCPSLNWLFIETPSLLDRYQVAANAGFGTVECSFPYDYSIEDLVKAKAVAKVEQVLINAHKGPRENDWGLAALPGREDDYLKSLETSVEYAKALQCKQIHIMSGKSLSNIVDEAMDEVYKDNLKKAVAMFEKEGIVALIEPINNTSTPYYYMNSFQKAINLVREFNSPYLKIQLDLFHLQIIEGNLTAKLKEYLPYTGHIQISQVPNRDEPNMPGEINYPYIFDVLKRENYQGYIGLEYKPSGDTLTGLKWMQEYGLPI